MVSKTLQRACQVLRARVRYRDAALRLPGSQGDTDTSVIREATRIYVETWIVPMLDAIERGDTKALAGMFHGSQGDPAPAWEDEQR